MKFLRIATLLGVFAMLSTALPAGATSATWTHSSKLTLPSNNDGGIDNGQLSGIVCPSANNCVAVGDYLTSSSGVAVVVLVESKGVWTPSTLAMPTNALTRTDAGDSPYAAIGQLSCSAVGTCAAVGAYTDTNDDTVPFVASDVDGSWGVAREVTLPSNPPAGEQEATVRSVDCPTAGNCVAVGTYLDNNTYGARSLAFVMNETNGVWQLNATSVEAPGTAPVNFNPYLSLDQVDCSSVGHCVAVGSYTDINGVTQGLIVDDTGGVWTSSQLKTPNQRQYLCRRLAQCGDVCKKCRLQRPGFVRHVNGRPRGTSHLRDK